MLLKLEHIFNFSSLHGPGLHGLQVHPRTWLKSTRMPGLKAFWVLHHILEENRHANLVIMVALSYKLMNLDDWHPSLTKFQHLVKVKTRTKYEMMTFLSRVPKTFWGIEVRWIISTAGYVIRLTNSNTKRFSTAVPKLKNSRGGNFD